MNQTKLLTVLFFIWGFLFSQESIGGRPYSLDNSLRTNISNFQTSGINAEELARKYEDNNDAVDS